MALLVLSKQHKKNLAFLNEVDADGERRLSRHLRPHNPSSEH